MLSLTDRLRERIQREGAISFHDWMAIALYDAEGGYYCSERQRWGRGGDYRTSPERSVLFAATFARYFAKLYQQLQSPTEWTVIEAGAGAGEFAAGVLNTLRVRSPEVYAATRYIVDEVSSDSRADAQRRLAEFKGKVRFERLDALAVERAGIVFTNELLDAFPVHRVTMQGGKVREFFVDTTEAGEFEWRVLDPSSERLETHFADAGIHLAEGQIAEVNLGIDDWLQSASAKLERGYLITVDYGAEAGELYSATARPGGTLRGFRRHQLTQDVLANPGTQDITSSVNWSQVTRAGEALGLETIEFESQDRFLMNEGLLEELELMVSGTADEAEKLRLRTSAREMILPEMMAASFQVLVQEKKSVAE